LKGAQSGLLTRTATTEGAFVVRADDKLTAFLEVETAICARQSGQRTVERREIKLDKLSRIK
jgi:hypothetical protein